MAPCLSGGYKGQYGTTTNVILTESLHYLLLCLREREESVPVRRYEQETRRAGVCQVGDVSVKESGGVKLGQTERSPALRVLERLRGVDHVEHQVKVRRVDEILLHPDQGDQVVVCQQDAEHHVLHLAGVPDDALRDDVPVLGGKGQTLDSRQEVGVVPVHLLGE